MRSLFITCLVTGLAGCSVGVVDARRAADDSAGDRAESDGGDSLADGSDHPDGNEATDGAAGGCDGACAGADGGDPLAGEPGGDTGPPPVSGNLTSAVELAAIRALADANVEPQATHAAAVLAVANAAWSWGTVSGEFITTEPAANKLCHPVGDVTNDNYFKNAGADVYAKVLGYYLSGDEDLLVEARARILDLTDTFGFTGLAGVVYSGSNQCILELAIGIPTWIEAAKLMQSTPPWSEADARAFAQWLGAEVFPKVAWASRVRKNNWGAAGSLTAYLVADYVAGRVATLDEGAPVALTLTPAQAQTQHLAQQYLRIGTTWLGDASCAIGGIQAHGGIPEELRRGSSGCAAASIAADDASLTYQTMHIDYLVFHAEALRRHGDPGLYEVLAPAPSVQPALLQAILFVIDNPIQSWPYTSYRHTALRVAHCRYGDPRLFAQAEAVESSFRGGTALPWAKLTHWCAD